MKLRASEFISKAEGLKSSELSIRQKLEGIRSRRSSIQSEISTLEFRLDSLYMQLEALESSDSDDENGADNSGAIAAVMAEISSTQDDISDCRQQDAELRSQEMEADAELRQIEMEEQETLSAIQNSAARTNQNIALISSFGGDYANVSAQASGSFQHNLGQLSQAAQILGGNVAMGVAGAGGRSAGRLARGNAGQTDGSGRNFYEAANNQRKSENSTPGAMGARGTSGTAGVRKAPSLYDETSTTPEQTEKKSGGFGKKGGGIKQSIANAFNLGGAIKPFSGCSAVKRSDQKDIWDIPGTGYSDYEDFRNNYNDFQRIEYDQPQKGMVSADSIEGIPNIRTADIEHPEIFWGRDSGKTMQDFMDIASHIPDVNEQLKNGRSLDDLLMDDVLGKCAAIYFADAPTVYKGDGFYEFSSNGRHRILAARALGLSIPVVIAGEIKSKKKTGLGNKAAFLASIKYTPDPVSGVPTANNVSSEDDVRGPRVRDIADELDRNLFGRKNVSRLGYKNRRKSYDNKTYSEKLAGFQKELSDIDILIENYAQNLEKRGLKRGEVMDAILEKHRNMQQAELLRNMNGDFSRPVAILSDQDFDAIIDNCQKRGLLYYSGTTSSPRSLSKTRYGFTTQTINGIEMKVYNDPIGTNSLLIQNQGQSQYDMEGTCGLCQSSNLLTLSGVTGASEDMIISAAMHSSPDVLESMELFNPDSEERGGTTVSDRQEILSRCGLKTYCLPVSYDRKETTEQLSEAIRTGHGVIVSVDVAYLWRNGQSGGHAITLLSVSEDGSTFIYNDTGSGSLGTISAKDLGRALTGRPANVTRDIIR